MAASSCRALATSGARILGAAVRDGDDEAVLVSPPSRQDDGFEIGSITKPITATVLATEVVGGRLALTDPIGTWLDAGPHGAITLEQLATHTSGLPRLAPNHHTHPGYDPADPYGAFDEARAEAGLQQATRADSGRHAYSNFGYQLLGICLSRATGEALDDLYRTRVFDPLGMGQATAALDATPLPGFADGAPVPHWRLLLPGPGGVVAPLADLLRFAAAVLAPPPTDLGAAIELTLQPRADGPGAQVGLGWMLHPAGLILHGGGTAGFTSQVVVNRAEARCVATFVNVGGFDLCQAMTMAAARGSDPNLVIPVPVDEDEVAAWIQVARDTSRSFGLGDFEGTRRHMDERTAEALPDDRLGPVWMALVEPLGRLSHPTLVSVSRRGTALEIELLSSQVDGSGRGLTSIVFLDPDRRVIGFQVR
jgi:CubicO group peptidase (beta-lactamase class C family)